MIDPPRNTRDYLRTFGLALLVVGCVSKEPGDSEPGSEASTDAATAPTSGAPETTEFVGTIATDGATGEPDGSTSEATTQAPPDMGGEGVECDPKGQDCPTGLKCTAYGEVEGDAWNANKCVPETGTGVAGEPCAVEGPDMFTGIDNCAKGFICLNTKPDGTDGFCVEFCSPDDACPNTSAGTGVCLPDGNDGHLPICLQTCDPLIQDCSGEQACYGGDPSWPYVCFTPDPKLGGQEGDGCDFTNACYPGLSCAAQATVDGCVGDAYGCCTSFCALDEDSCAAPEVCTPFYPMPPPGFENVGVCTLPG